MLKNNNLWVVYWSIVNKKIIVTDLGLLIDLICFGEWSQQVLTIISSVRLLIMSLQSTLLFYSFIERLHFAYTADVCSVGGHWAVVNGTLYLCFRNINCFIWIGIWRQDSPNFDVAAVHSRKRLRVGRRSSRISV